MKATEVLMEEHRLIERVIAALETAALRLEESKPVQARFFFDVADFIKHFADGCHHRKEEGVLFEAMVAHGMSKQIGPIAVMLAEHEQGRTYTRNMRQAAEKLAEGDETARQPIIENGRGYAALLRQHIFKEDNILFPMADQVIPASEHDGVMDDFERIEHEETGAGVHEKYLALADALEKEMAAL